jgi:ABC-2 type transport system permease protein
MTALKKLTWVELKLFAREPLALVFTFGLPLVVLVSLVGSFDPGDPAFGGARPSDYYLASYVAVVIGAIGLIAVPVHVAAYRERGILRRLRASSVPPWTSLGAQAAVGLLTAVAGGAVLVVAGGAVLVVAGRLPYGAALPASTGRVALAFVLSTLSFLTVGFLLGSLAGSARSAQAIGMILFFPMWLLSGAGPPPEVMGEGMRRVSDLLPLTYAVRSLQDPWLGSGSSTTDLALLAGILVIAALVAVRRLRSA